MNNENADKRIKNLITEFILKDNYWGFLFSRINRKEDKMLTSWMGFVQK